MAKKIAKKKAVKKTTKAAKKTTKTVAKAVKKTTKKKATKKVAKKKAAKKVAKKAAKKVAKKRATRKKGCQRRSLESVLGCLQLRTEASRRILVCRQTRCRQEGERTFEWTEGQSLHPARQRTNHRSVINPCGATQSCASPQGYVLAPEGMCLGPRAFPITPCI